MEQLKPCFWNKPGVIIKLSLRCQGDIKRVCQSSHVPGKLTCFADKWTNDAVRYIRWQKDAWIPIQSSDDVLMEIKNMSK